MFTELNNKEAPMHDIEGDGSRILGGWRHVVSARANEYGPHVVPEPMSVQSPSVTTPVFLNHCQAYPG